MPRWTRTSSRSSTQSSDGHDGVCGRGGELVGGGGSGSGETTASERAEANREMGRNGGLQRRHTVARRQVRSSRTSGIDGEAPATRGRRRRGSGASVLLSSS